MSRSVIWSSNAEHLLYELYKAHPNFVDITTPSTSGQELAIAHDLGRVPKGVVIVKGDPGYGGVPIGTIIDYGSTTVPAGYLACDGSAVSRTTYSALYAIIGTTFGSGDGSTTFNLPDLSETGNIFFGAEDLFPLALGFYSAAAARATVSGCVIQGFVCADGVLNSVAGLKSTPSDYGGSAMTGTIYWVSTSSSTNSGLFGLGYGCMPSNTDVSTSFSFADPDITHKLSANQGAKKMNAVSFTALAPTNAGPSRPLWVFAGRVGDHASDNLAADLNIVGVKLTYKKLSSGMIRYAPGSSTDLGSTTTWTDKFAYMKFVPTSRALTVAFF